MVGPIPTQPIPVYNGCPTNLFDLAAVPVSLCLLSLRRFQTAYGNHLTFLDLTQGALHLVNLLLVLIDFLCVRWIGRRVG